MTTLGTQRPDTQFPRVSVIMPVKNGERFLDEAIQSVLTQTLKELELIVVVNGSTDASFEIASRYADEDPRVRVIRLDSGNIPIALNTGIAHARAPWIARMDADDISLPGRLERQLAVVELHPDVGAVGTWGWRVGANGKRVSTYDLGPTNHQEFYRIRDAGLTYLLSSSVMFSREVALRLGGFHEDYKVTQDVEFWTRIADDHVVLALPERLVCYRVHGSAVSSSQLQSQLHNVRLAENNMRRRRRGLPELSLEEFQALERQRPRLERLLMSLRARSQYCYRRGGSMLAARNPLGVAWLLGSLLLYPPLPVTRLRQQGVLQVALGQFFGRRERREHA